jgi:hypothetical protein
MSCHLTKSWLEPVRDNYARRSSSWNPVEVNVFPDDKSDARGYPDAETITRIRIERLYDWRCHYLYLDETDGVQIANHLLQSLDRKSMSAVMIDEEHISRMSTRDMHDLIDLCNNYLENKKGRENRPQSTIKNKKIWNIRDKKYRTEIQKTLIASLIKMKLSEIIDAIQSIKKFCPEMTDDIDDFANGDMFSIECAFSRLMFEYGIDMVWLGFNDSRD